MDKQILEVPERQQQQAHHRRVVLPHRDVERAPCMSWVFRDVVSQDVGFQNDYQFKTPHTSQL